MFRRIICTTRRASRYTFTAHLQELLLISNAKSRPNKIAISFVHRKKKSSSKVRAWEESFSDPNMCILVWPEQQAEKVQFISTLYNAADDEYEDKEWSIVVEEVTDKGKRKVLASKALNLRQFVSDNAENEKIEMKLKMDPAVKGVTRSNLVILLTCELLSRFGEKASSISAIEKVGENSTDEVPKKEPEQRQLEDFAATMRAVDKGEVARINAIKDHLEDDEPPPIPAHSNVRPPWRLSTDENMEKAKETPATVTSSQRASRSIRTSVEEKPNTKMVFEVNEDSKAIPVPITPVSTNLTTPKIHSRSQSPRPPVRTSKPEPIPGESLLAWTQRATEGYPGVKIVDFTRSWRTGLPLCALIHVYREDLIDFEQLDIHSTTLNGKKMNVKKGLSAAAMMGMSDLPDENDILTPNRKAIEGLLERIRRIVEGGSDDTPHSMSDHRISQMFAVSESEKKVVEEINKIRERRDLEDAVDFTNIQDDDYDAEIEEPRQFNRGNNSRSSTLPRKRIEINGNGEMSSMSFGRGEVVVTAPGVSSTLRSSGRNASPSKREELRRQARALLEKSTISTPSTSNKETDDERRRIARKMIETAVTDVSRSAYSTPRNNQKASNLRMSATDLRRVEVFRPQVDVHRFRKRDPSPTLVRKPYNPNDQNILPAISKFGGSQNRLEDISTFDRVKRYGSMRSAELKDSLAELAKQYGYGNLTASQENIYNEPRKNSSSQWQNDVDDIEGTTMEQERIEQRLADVEEQSEAINAKIREAEQGSNEETMLLHTFIELTDEKNRLVGRQEYFNIIQKIRAVVETINRLTNDLDAITKDQDDYMKTPDEKRRTDRLMAEYTNALDEKSNLVQQAISTIDEIKEDEVRLKNLTLERASKFVRGNEEPVSASKRLIQWWKK